MKEKKVFIADDHPVMRDGIRSIISRIDGCLVVGEAGTGPEAVSKIEDLKPDLVIMDITMPELDGIAVTRRITESLPDVKIIIHSMHPDVYSAIEAFRAGALGYVLKDASPDEFLAAVKKVLDGGKFASPAVAEDLLDGFVEKIRTEESSDPLDSLSSREKEVMRMLADGATSKEIAEKLYISVSTVKSHRNKIMKKLDIKDMASLVKLALKKGIITHE